MFEPSFMRSKCGNKLVELFGRLVLTTIMIIMIIVTMMKKTRIIYDCNHKLAKQRNRERRFDGLRLSPNVSLHNTVSSLNKQKEVSCTYVNKILIVCTEYMDSLYLWEIKKSICSLQQETIQLYKVTTRTEISNKYIFPVRNGLQVGHREDLETHAKLHTCILLTKFKKKVV